MGSSFRDVPWTDPVLPLGSGSFTPLLKCLEPQHRCSASGDCASPWGMLLRACSRLICQGILAGTAWHCLACSLLLPSALFRSELHMRCPSTGLAPRKGMGQRANLSAGWAWVPTGA